MIFILSILPKTLKFFNILPLVLLTAFFLFQTSDTPAQSDGEEYLAFAETMPEPVGGLKAIFANVKL